MQRRGEIATDFFANRVDLFSSAKTTLEQLREMKLALAVATSSVSASARPLLDRTGIRSLFSVVITGDEVQQGKPHPDIYLRAAKKLGISPEACLVIEDAPQGVQAGLDSGAHVAAVCTSRQASELKDAHLVIESLNELNPTIVRRVLEYHIQHSPVK